MESSRDRIRYCFLIVCIVHRLIKAVEIFEYEYQDENHKPITPRSTKSRNRAASSSRKPSASTEHFQDQYTTDPSRDPISQLSNAIARTTLREEALPEPPPELNRNHPHPQAHVTTAHPKYGSEEFDPSKIERSFVIQISD